MKINYAQLSTHLTQKLAAIYVVSGDEVWLKQEAIQLIRKAAKKAGVNERIRLTPQAGFDWGDLYSLLYAHSLLSEKRLIELDFREDSPPKTAATILQDYVTHPSPDTTLLIDLAKVDVKIAKSAWYQALEKSAVMIAIWPIPREQLPAWLITRAQKYQLTLQKEAAHFLTDYVEGNLSAAAQIIEKIYLLKPTNEIDIECVKTILTDESCYTLFDLIEMLIAGEPTKALHILRHLQQDGTDPILILWAITRELRLMTEIALKHQQGSRLESLFQQHKIFPRRQSAVRRFLTIVNPEKCWGYLVDAAEIDKLVKGAMTGNVWDRLEMLSLKIATLPSPAHLS